MRKLLIILFVVISSVANATIYYCSPTGTDGAYPGRGTLANPWKTWHYAFNTVTPSDTVYFRGGTYAPYSASIGANLKTTAVDGTHDAPTCFFAYPEDWAAGNYPILDCQTMMTDYYNWGIEVTRASHIYFKGLFLINVRQTVLADINCVGWYVYSEGYTDRYAPNDIKWENCVVKNTGGSGFGFAVFDTINVINCDSYFNCDTLSTYDAGGSGNGFLVSVRGNTYDYAEQSYAYFYGCRAWMCSDQGFAYSSQAATIFDNCWSIFNGDMPFPENIYSKGSGFKFWIASDRMKNTTDVVQITMRNCITAHNAFKGINFTDSGEPTYKEVRAHIYNNFSYDDTHQVDYKGPCWGYNVEDAATTDTVGYYDHLYYNNLSYYNTTYRDLLTGATNGSNNLFNVVGTPVTNAYFASLDTAGMLGVDTRKSDWSLPDTDFGKPAAGSPLIDAGVDVFGIPFSGSAPDIGWAESSPIIADHTVVDKYDDIPAQWIDSVKKMWLSTPGLSHSRAYRDGLSLLEALDATYDVSVTTSGTPEAYTTAHLRASHASWGSYWYTTGWQYGSFGGGDWFGNPTALQRTKDGILYCDNNDLTISAYALSWCWDMVNPSGVSAGADPVTGNHWYGATVYGPEGDLPWGLDDADNAVTGNSVNLDSYLEATQEYIDYCEANNIPTKIFFTTGTVDSYSTGEDGYQGNLKNERIRDYVDADPTRILFDYADILCWDDNGVPTTTTWNGNTYPTITDLNEGDGTVGHIDAVGALRIGKALWWMLARMAGWDGAVASDIDSTATDILGFTLADQTGAATINTTNHTITIEVAYTADITSLTPTITLDYGATIIPASGVARNFTSPLPYTVTALNGVTTREWTVTVTQEADPVVPPVASTGAIVKFNGKIVKR